jgi:hypothetical protein
MRLYSVVKRLRKVGQSIKQPGVAIEVLWTAENAFFGHSPVIMGYGDRVDELPIHRFETRSMSQFIEWLRENPDSRIGSSVVLVCGDKAKRFRI